MQGSGLMKNIYILLWNYFNNRLQTQKTDFILPSTAQRRYAYQKS